MSTLGLDIGTTGCKAVAFSAQGRPLSQAYRDYPLAMPHAGWAELDSQQVLDAALAVVREAAGACGADAVQALAVSCQGEAFTPVGQGGRLLGRAMVSSDMRALAKVHAWSQRPGVAWLYQRTGHTPHPMFTLFKLDWVRQHQPEVWRSAAQFLCFEDLFAWRLGLTPTMGHPLAGRTMLFNIHQRGWDRQILEQLELEPTRLAATAASGTVVGEIPAAMARELGLAPGAVLVSGGHDQACAALGAGVVRSGVAMYASGTVECISPAFAAPVQSDELCAGNLCTYHHAVPGMFTTVAFSLTGGNLLKWYRQQWGGEWEAQATAGGADVYDLIIDSMSAQPPGLLVLPYFTPSGTPHFDTRTPGALLGLRLSTTRGEVLRALLEGVAMEMRLNLDLLGRSGAAITQLRAVGGGARNRKLLQLKADVLNRPITQVAVTEAGCLGTAMLARAALTGDSLATLAESWVRQSDTLMPNPATVEHYQRQFDRYRQLQPVLSTLDWSSP